MEKKILADEDVLPQQYLQNNMEVQPEKISGELLPVNFQLSSKEIFDEFQEKYDFQQLKTAAGSELENYLNLKLWHGSTQGTIKIGENGKGHGDRSLSLKIQKSESKLYYLYSALLKKGGKIVVTKKSGEQVICNDVTMNDDTWYLQFKGKKSQGPIRLAEIIDLDIEE